MFLHWFTQLLNLLPLNCFWYHWAYPPLSSPSEVLLGSLFCTTCTKNLQRSPIWKNLEHHLHHRDRNTCPLLIHIASTCFRFGHITLRTTHKILSVFHVLCKRKISINCCGIFNFHCCPTDPLFDHSKPKFGFSSPNPLFSYFPKPSPPLY